MEVTQSLEKSLHLIEKGPDSEAKPLANQAEVSIDLGVSPDMPKNITLYMILTVPPPSPT